LELGFVFIIQGKPREPDGIVKVVKEKSTGGAEAARDLRDKSAFRRLATRTN
jgi:hypothetical protein